MKNNFIIKRIVTLVILFFTLLTSCEKDNTLYVPDNQKDITESHHQLKNVISTLDKDKIWVTTPILYDDSNLLNFFTFTRVRSEIISPFFIGYDFNSDNSIKIYLSTNIPNREVKSNDTALFPDNPNTYRVGGALRNEITIESKGILSDLKRAGVMDFEYFVDKYKKDSISLTSAYSGTSTTVFGMFQYDKKDFFEYLYVTRKLFVAQQVTIGGTLYNYLSGDNNVVTTLHMEDVDGNKLVEIPILRRILLADIIHQYFDVNRNKFIFKVVQEFSRLSPLGNYTTVNTFVEKVIEKKVEYFDIEKYDNNSITLKSYAADKTYRIVINLR